MSCPSDEMLAAYAASDLEPAAQESVAAHLAAGCEACRGELGFVEQLRRLADPAVAPEPPSWVLARAERIPAEAREQGIVARIYRTAALIVDSMRDPMPAAARAVLTEARHLLFRIDDFDIDVRVSPAGAGQARVSGQVLPPADDASDALEASIVLSHPAYGVLSRPGNAFGEFTFDSVPEGDYSLVVESGEHRILVERLSVRSGSERT